LNTTTIGGNKYFLIGLDEFSGYIHVTPLESKGNKDLTKAFTTLIAFYKSFKFDIKLIQTDHEANLWSCKNHINIIGTQLMQVGPYQHAQRMERHVQEINKSMRTTLASLPYELYGELLYCTIYNKNNVQGANHPTSLPRIIMEGRRLELSKRLLVPFGQLAIQQIK
jgi:hypothetical protein